MIEITSCTNWPHPAPDPVSQTVTGGRGGKKIYINIIKRTAHCTIPSAVLHLLFVAFVLAQKHQTAIFIWISPNCVHWDALFFVFFYCTTWRLRLHNTELNKYIFNLTDKIPPFTSLHWPHLQRWSVLSNAAVGRCWDINPAVHIH